MKTIEQPKIISVHNKMDELVSAYCARIRQRKWYWPIFVYPFNVAISNDWLLIKKLKPKDKNCYSITAAVMRVFEKWFSFKYLYLFCKDHNLNQMSAPTPFCRNTISNFIPFLFLSKMFTSYYSKERMHDFTCWSLANLAQLVFLRNWKLFLPKLFPR